MKKYNVSFWEKESVWVRRTVEIETDEKPTEENLDEFLSTKHCDYKQSDYDWETSDHEQYDFDTDFEVEEA